MNIENQIAKRIKTLRKERGYTLSQLAKSSGVSSSTISLIERCETSPTAAILNKLADAMSVTLASIFSSDASNISALPVSRRSEQSTWSDPDSGYVRRHLSPNGCSTPVKLIEVIFPPGKSVAFESLVGATVIHQQIWIIEGEMNISGTGNTWNLKTGDCLAMIVDQHLVFHNPASEPSRYLVALSTL